ncbi:YbaY family lipoprotein [Yoonia sediminilitoris]|uniref:Putative lipoprotein n=1 Tax=Yoonia sediminilitoris TaxID=1286148 RepID=A0A2T6KM27_9RHOB|nr:YbaY family lipoprotein [Yoonia sediminilitoris]PUB17231.1 putative lipoprotein [Yoonia sediminilitoris]RCW97526.1 putative lipoprotein [Yoonia sediminilitoris]
MRYALQNLSFLFCLIMPLNQAYAQTTIDVAVSYRERIALPPLAELHLELLDVSRTDTAAKPLSSLRRRITGVPMQVELHYDADLIAPEGVYALAASIWSGDSPIFRSTERYDPFSHSEDATLEMMLSAVDEAATVPPTLQHISGVEWAITEILGEPWSNDDPATLIIDDESNFELFGGCNRFIGQLLQIDGEISFPANFAGTMMACPDETERLERSVLDALPRAASYVRYRTGLVLMDASGIALMHFTVRPE